MKNFSAKLIWRDIKAANFIYLIKIIMSNFARKNDFNFKYSKLV
jgi:hypothetical protein